MKKETFLLVDSAILPAIFMKIIEVKTIATKSPARSINSIVDEVGISRSAYYKYKDHVFPFYETSHGRLLTIFFVVDDITGILASIIQTVAASGSNILTINQNMPVNGIADVSISIETENMTCELSEFMQKLKELNGVRKCEIIARD